MGDGWSFFGRRYGGVKEDRESSMWVEQKRSKSFYGSQKLIFTRQTIANF